MGWLVAQNDSNNSYNPDLWSKFEWTMDSDEVLLLSKCLCGSDEQAAIDAAGADNDRQLAVVDLVGLKCDLMRFFRL